MTTIRTCVGIDIGSVSVKVVTIENGEIVRALYRRFQGGPFETLQDILENEFAELSDSSVCLGLTGIGGKTAQSILGGKFFGEIGALGAANTRLLPQVRTVIEMGGEDSKLLIIDPEQGVVADFAMNAQCAAGTGSFLDQQAGRLKINIVDDFGRMALKSKNPPRIAGRCSVFAKSDMIHLQQIATPDYDIVAGLCFAVARNFKSSIARGKKFEQPIAFEGGVAANAGMVRAFTDILDLEEGELVVPEHFNVMGAIGAAFLASAEQSETKHLSPDRIKSYLNYRQAAEASREALHFDFPENKFYDITNQPRPTDIDNRDVYLGIDIGSLSTNLALIDNDHNVIARRYLMTEGRPIEAVRRGLEEIGGEVGSKVNVRAVGTTGSGRYLIGDFVGADIIRNEITAQATAAINIDPTVDTIFEIGGQDSKYVAIDNCSVIDFEMNKACAAGTGSFLQEQAEKLNISIEREFGDRALCAKCPVGCGERCTVFMESDLVAHQRQGASKDDLIAGLAYSIASNYLTRVVGDRRIGDHIFFQGGVAWNKAVVAAFEKLVGKKITVPPHHDVTGAIGAAILAIEADSGADFKSRFKGFDLHKRRYELTSFPCEDCSNQCEIHVVEIEGDAPLYYGARCEKFEVDKSGRVARPPSYANLRQRLLQKRYLKFDNKETNRATVGMPRVLHFFEFYPFWRAFFESAGFKIVNSDVTGQSIVEDSLELFIAETCYPIKLVYGHIANLVNKKVDYIFLPSIIKVSDINETKDCGAFICPYVQTIGSSINTRFDFDAVNIKLVQSALSLSYDLDDLKEKLKALAAQFRLSDKEYNRAVESGLKAFKMFKAALKDEGKKILADLGPDEKALVIVSRPYNGYDRKLSLGLPEKIRDLGYKAIPIDFLPIEESEDDLTHMYWRYGRRILQAAEYIRKQPNLFAVYVTSFGCGPDSFITHFFRRKMSGKPYLQLELDEHSADAGMITRCEAFIDSLRFHEHAPPLSSFNVTSDKFKPFEKTIYIPNMCDHAYALAAAFQRFGLTAEVLDEPDSETLECGKQFTSGKECFPCVITTGDMIKRIRSDKFDRDRSVFFMPGAGGPCRFGLYSQFHRMILHELGYSDIPVFSPNSEDGYGQFGLEGTKFRHIAWRSLVFVDGLIKLLHRYRPYEVETGSTEKLYYHYLNELNRTVVNDLSLDELADKANKEFSSIATSGERKPLVGVVGEIYLRNNRFSNNHLITKLEGLGLEVWLATFAEWPLYTSHTFLRDSFIAREFKNSLKATLQIFVQSRMEHKLIHRITRGADLPSELPVRKVIKAATRYLPIDYKGEAILSIGKSIDMVSQGAGGVVNAMPFNCMPGTVVSALSKKVSEDLQGVPWLNISYEGLRDSGEETRLEAFAEQVRAFDGRSSKSARTRIEI